MDRKYSEGRRETGLPIYASTSLANGAIYYMTSGDENDAFFHSGEPNCVVHDMMV
jgi:hypothetical protein